MWLNQHHQHPPICVFHNILLSYVIGITLFVCCWLVIVIDCQPPLVAPQQYIIRTTTEHDSQERQSTTTTSQRTIDQKGRNDIPNDEYYVGIASYDM